MGSHNSRVCVLSGYDVEQYIKYRITPNCDDHEHMSRSEALDLTCNLLYKQITEKGWVSVFEASWVNVVGKKAIVFHDPRSWVIKKSGLYDVHQLAHLKS